MERSPGSQHLLSVTQADRLWSRLKQHIVPMVEFKEGDKRCETGMDGCWHAIGCSSNLLFVKYGPGGHFSPHTDGYTIHDFNCR